MVHYSLCDGLPLCKEQDVPSVYVMLVVDSVRTSPNTHYSVPLSSTAAVQGTVSDQ